jgi:hypothetical protein
MHSRSLRRWLAVIVVFWVRPGGELGAALETGHRKIGGDAWGGGGCLGVVGVIHDDILRVSVDKTVGRRYLVVVVELARWRCTTVNGDCA